MNAEQIRDITLRFGDSRQCEFLREIAAQLAELNENLKIFFTPVYIVDGEKIDKKTILGQLKNSPALIKIVQEYVPEPVQSPAKSESVSEDDYRPGQSIRSSHP